MANAIGMLEVKSIAKGMALCDAMVKSAQVELLSAASGCPGRYTILLGGETASVRTALNTGIALGGNKIFDSFFLANLHPQVLEYFGKKNREAGYGAVGIAEYSSVAAAVLGADKALKAAQVTLIEFRHGFCVGGRGYFTLTGDVGAVRSAMERATQGAHKLIDVEIIPRPAPDFFETLR